MCEIKNDTNIDMWIVHKANWGAVGWTVGTAVTVVGGVIAVAVSAGTAAPGAIAAITAFGEGIGIAGLGTGAVLSGVSWTVLGASLSFAARFLDLTPADVAQLDKDLKLTPAGKDVIVHTKKTKMQIFEENSKEDLAKGLNVSVDKIEMIQKIIHDSKHGDGAKRIAPGKSYKFSAVSCSVWVAHVLNENMEEDVQNVWTGFWWGTTRKYKATTLFKDLHMNLEPITVRKEA